MSKQKDAFTLIEVMVSVMIISVVIMALLQMQGNSTHIFSRLKSNLEVNQYASYFILNSGYGFNRKTVSLYTLLNEFQVEDNLRRELKDIKVDIKYDKLERYGDSNGSEEKSSSVVLEIGKSVINMNNSTVSLIRLRLQ
jgi:prepilin-type N-terminal cleavage/methylation domain-containing protein